jgi:hypothetical protein
LLAGETAFLASVAFQGLFAQAVEGAALLVFSATVPDAPPAEAHGCVSHASNSGTARFPLAGAAASRMWRSHAQISLGCGVCLRLPLLGHAAMPLAPSSSFQTVASPIQICCQNPALPCASRWCCCPGCAMHASRVLHALASSDSAVKQSRVMSVMHLRDQDLKSCQKFLLIPQIARCAASSRWRLVP